MLSVPIFSFSTGLVLNHYDYNFSPSGFSFTDTDDSQDSKGKEGTICYSTLPLYHPLTNIYTFICDYACEMTVTYF